ncbi:MAG: hypothetical protein GXO73_07645 [Calditrichaeota bacterium]|nr:hypothetical protein [Calditrichota bacterium]
MRRSTHAQPSRAVVLSLLLTAAVFGLAGTTRHARAQSVRARLNTAVYTWQSVPGATGSATHVRAYQVVNLTVGRIVTPRLSFHAYTAVMSDLSGKILDDPRAWLYNAYFRLALRGAEIRLGRQRVFAGVGFGTIDGLRVIARAFKRVEVDVFGGPRMPLDNGFGISDAGDNAMWGGRLRTIGWRNTRVALSFVEKHRVRHASLDPSEFLVDYQLLKAVNSLEQRRVGLDIWQGFGRKTSLGARLDYDLLMSRIQRAEVNARAGVGSFQFGLDYIFRNPLVDANSIFSVFAQESNWEVAGRVLYFFTPSTGVFVRVAHVGLEGISTNRVTFGFRSKGGYLGLSSNSGYGGDRWGVVGDYRWRLSKRLWLNLGSNYGIYRYYGLDGDWEHTLAAYFGATTWLRRGLRLDAELQGLQNRHVDSDLRFLVRLSTTLRKR